MMQPGPRKLNQLPDEVLLENVLATRAGLKSLQSYLETLALSAADMDAESGRA